MMDGIFMEDKSRVQLFMDYFDSKSENVWNHFFNFLQRTDMVCVYQVSKIITKLACWSSRQMELKSLRYFFDWLQDHLCKPHNEYLQTIARNLQMILRVKSYRGVFVEQRGVET